MPGVIAHYFGEADTLETLTARGLLLQSEGYKCLFEEARRQKPRCAMALNWCYNEPWPTAANCSIINWPCRPKPAYYAVQAACRPTLASARLPKFEFFAGETAAAELWVISDAPRPVPAGEIDVILEVNGERTRIGGWAYPEVAANENLRGPDVRFTLPQNAAGCFRILLETKREETRSEYTLICKIYKK
jgi:beta-mannosidase